MTNTPLFSHKKEDSSFHNIVTWGGSWVGWVNSYFAGCQASQRRASPLISTLGSYKLPLGHPNGATHIAPHVSRTTRCAVIPHTPGTTADPGSSRDRLGAGSSHLQELNSLPILLNKVSVIALLFSPSVTYIHCSCLHYHMPNKSN